MVSSDSKSYQLRVRVTPEERDHLEKLRRERGRGETLSDLVREAISLLITPAGAKEALAPKTKSQIERLAVLLQREPQQVENACIEGILDLIELKCEVPLIVMETRLYLQYRNRNESQEFPWNTSGDPAPAEGLDSSAVKPAS
jgi:Arc/MetJ-type ribon-helix-helix transcriptional regulator